jgi:DUF1009 family protein
MDAKNMEEITKIGLIAGGGMMPVEIIRLCRARGIEVYVAGLSPWADETAFQGVEHVAARIGEVGKMMKFFKTHGVVELVLAGGIKRPSLKELIPDVEAVKILAKVALKKTSDDGLFRAVIDQIEERGFHVLGIEEIVPEMLFQEGVYGRVRPSSDDMDDIRRGVEVARAVGAVDVGQAVVVQEGIVLAVEAVEGTDAMLSRAASLRKPGKAPVMVKIVKPGQDTRVDMPAMGLQTIEQLAKYGMGGIAVEAGGILVIEREAVIAAADAAKIFIIGMDLSK